MITISNKKRAFIIGVLILAAYSMLTYSITNNILLGVITDIVSGLAVIWIPLLIFPVFNSKNNKLLTYAYVIPRFIEGILMIIGGLFILIPFILSWIRKISDNRPFSGLYAHGMAKYLYSIYANIDNAKKCASATFLDMGNLIIFNRHYNYCFAQ